MSNEHNDLDIELDEKNPGTTTEAGENTPSTEANLSPQNWEDAFAQLEAKAPEKSRPATIPPSTSDDDGDKGDGGTPGTDGSTDSPDNSALASDNLGGPVPSDGDDSDSGGFGYDPAQIESRITEYQEKIERQAIDDTAQLMLSHKDDKGRPAVRSHDGVLGATINDDDIYRRDESGVATFYNPDTGRPFTGDNPRAQAKQWVDAYNEELKEAFNTLAQTRIGELSQEASPAIELLKFTPTYEGLDPVRQRMLEGIIGDYEVFDAKGKHIGYSCDLNKALSQVNRQVENIKAHQEANRPATDSSATPASTPASQAKPSSGPALDMKTGGSASGDGKKPEFKSIAEAMEYEQDEQLKKLSQKGRK